MCRIFAAILKGGKASPILTAGLKRLEYGGYDSAGIATIHNGRLFVKKDAGKINEVDRRLDFGSLPGSLGIAHNRWATHGAPVQVNAHPHTDCKGSVAVVHNGIIENFAELKKELLDKGHHFISKTDTEVVAHLVEEYLLQGISFRDACLHASRRLEGSYALAVISTVEPSRIMLLRKDSPLLLGLSDEGNFASSDAVAFIDHTQDAVPLDSGEMAELTSSAYSVFRTADGKAVLKKPIRLEWTLEEASKEGFPHFMLKEIFEQSRSLHYALNLQKPYLELMAELLDRSKTVYLVAAGTSYHSCVAASYIYSELAALTAIPVVASEFVEQYGRSVNVDSTVLLVSQSGETADVLRAAEYVKAKAATVLGITNVLGSTLTRVTRAYLLQQSGPELGVAATKTYASQLLTHMQLALYLGKKRGKLSQSEVDYYLDAFKKTPELVEQALREHDERMKKLARKYLSRKHFFFLARGLNTATALEARLKLSEIACTPSTALPAGESKHGPISLVEKGVPAVFIAPDDGTNKLMEGNIMEMKARGAEAIILGARDDEKLRRLSDEYVALPPDIPGILTPIVYVVPLQLFAYHMAVEKGLDPDKPRNLAKSVTVL
ncbi:glutamine--fructose-6-phosphate transaminase (isomerizing) [Candidatus Hecatella orcuttiae]|jgi:glucosamine--fructose-6-phosphate aminotransferase (isomerizing)|uniref:glutamine--fructose-6-phosphate transaminase (isomerizing) n=1 Tax=Candidatus Hecatella orcuttiae TaxID=1935119 RepID=UPI002867BFF7|nr:glutamine--fructose-6-phosphate transaminase (isomerizing) [Candidatus Hecatella orcuttiae]